MISTKLLTRLLAMAVAPLGCASPSAPAATAPTTSSAPTATPPTATAAPPGASPPSAPPSPGTTPKGGVSTGGSSTTNGCYDRTPGEACLAPESADASARLKLGVDGTVKHLKTATGTDATCCYAITSVSKGRVLVVGDAIRLAPLIRRAFV